MPITVKVIHHGEFLKTTATGVLDFAASKKALIDIASQIEQSGDFDVLVDTRGAEAKLSTTELYELGEALAAAPSLRQSRIGLLAPPSEADDARFLETVARNRGVDLRGFVGFEQAISWLVMREPAPSQ